MELFRWILILAGVGILALLYFSGRPKRGAQRDALELPRGSTAQERHLNDDQYPQGSHYDDHYPQGDHYDDLADSDDGYAQPGPDYQTVNSSDVDVSGDPLLNDPGSQFDDLADIDPDDFARPGTGDVLHNSTEPASGGVRSSIAQKIESFSSRLSPRRSQRVANVGSAESRSHSAAQAGAVSEAKSKIVTIHVVAPQDQVFNGATLYELFEQRGFHFGEMNIFHSIHHQQKMFSIAKMVEPGYFDINAVSYTHLTLPTKA